MYSTCYHNSSCWYISTKSSVCLKQNLFKKLICKSYDRHGYWKLKSRCFDRNESWGNHWRQSVDYCDVIVQYCCTYCVYLYSVYSLPVWCVCVYRIMYRLPRLYASCFYCMMYAHFYYLLLPTLFISLNLDNY